MATQIVGRMGELAVLRAALVAAEGRSPHVVIVEGPAGSGKTALVGAFVQRYGGGRHVWWASGDEVEQRMAYGVAHQLFARARSGRQPPAASEDPLVVGGWLLDEFGAPGDDRALIVVVDDAQLSDASSLQALGFAVRRLRADRLLVVLTVRSGELDRLPSSLRQLAVSGQADWLHLTGLSVEEVQELAQLRGHGGMTRAVARRLLSHTDGLPLYVVTVLEEHTADELAAANGPLRAPRAFERSVRARLDQTDPATVTFVQAAAVLGMRAEFRAATAVSEVAQPMATHQAAIDARILVGGAGGVVVFAHRLVHSAVYHAVPVTTRQQLHRRAATVVPEHEASLRHRLAAADQPDDDLATTTVAVAARLTAAGELELAAEMHLEAARLATDADVRERAQLAAADLLLMAGATTSARSLLPVIEALPPSSGRSYALGQSALVAGLVDQAQQGLRDAWILGGAGSEHYPARAAEQLAVVALVEARPGDAVRWIRRAIARATPGALGGPLDTLALALTLSGHADVALAETARLSVGASPGADGLVGRGVALLWQGRHASAAALLTRAAAREDRQRPFLPWGLLGLCTLAQVNFLQGVWDEALSHSELAISIAQDTEQRWLEAFARAIAALTLTARGADDDAEEEIRMGRAALTDGNLASGRFWIVTAEAMLAVMRHDWDRVVEVTADLRGSPGVTDHPGWARWREHRIEALVELAQCDRAEEELDAYEGRVRRTRTGWREPAVLRLRGLLEMTRGRPDVATTLLGRAEHAAMANTPLPFELALIRRDRGRALLRRSRVADAAAAVHAAAVGFEELGARSLVEECNALLEQLGRPPWRSSAGATSVLTPHELAVARLIQDGCSNKEAASRLFVSVKTIEYHLSNTYAKLGVSSRTQLARLMHDEP